MPEWDYDIIIIGGGPAGLTAGIYAGRARLKTLLLERLIHGGQVMTTDLVENYPGFPQGISGYELSDRMRQQAERFGLEFRTAEVLEVKPGPPSHRVMLEGGALTAGAVILACGARHKRLGVPGEHEFTGKGVSFCATCDGALYRDQDIALVGGGDNALTEALFLARFARKIHVIHRRHEFRAARYLQERVFQLDRAQVHWDTVVTEVKGGQAVESLELRNVHSGEHTSLPVTGVFVTIGMVPNTGLLKNRFPLDEEGFLLTDVNMATDIPGIFAAGDIRSKSVRQIATAVGDGAVAVLAAEKFLEDLKRE